MKRLAARTVRHTSTLLFASIFVGCATTQSVVPTTPAPVSAIAEQPSATKNPSPSEPKAQDVRLQSHLVDVSPLHDSTDYWQGPTPEGAAFAGTYTRLVIKSTFVDSQGERQATDIRQKTPYLKRQWLERAIVGKDFSVVVTAKLKIPNALDISVPLAIIGHTSNSDGENWIREIYFERRDFPLFLVKRTGEASTPSITAEIKGSNSISSRGVAAGVSALNRLASVAGALPALITTLNKDSTKDASDKIDAEISKLLSSSATERSVWDRSLTNWIQTDRTLSKGGIEVAFRLPSEDNWENAQPMGSWMITFAPPRPSIFSDWHLCTNETRERATSLRCSLTLSEAIASVKAEVKPAEILNYKLLTGTSNFGSIHSFVKSKEWYTAGAAALAKVANTNLDLTLDPAASEFCRNVINEVTSLDLTQTDAELVLWALHTMGRPEFSVLDRNPDCAKQMNLSSTARID
jgi:hypothetical protein